VAKQLGADGDTDPQFELAAAAYDADGRVLNSIMNTTQESGASGDGHRATKDLYRVEQQLEAPLDAKFIHFVVRNTRTRKVGAMEISLPLAPVK
jgi:hypothetical protein